MQKLKQALLVIGMVLSITVIANAHEGHDHQHDAAATSSAFADIKEFPDCLHCGMDRDKFSHSRMLVTYVDGTKAGTCSITCVVTERKKNPNKPIKKIEVADYATKNLLDAKTAVWVIGGKKTGVMTPVAKWAFAKRQDAEKFVKANGGRITTFGEAMKKAEAEF